MNKKVFTALLGLVTAMCVLSGLTACNSRTVEIYGERCAHVYGKPEYTPATCTSMGYELSVCSLCGDKDYDFIPAKGHVWDSGIYITQSDCDHNGLMRFTCTECRTDKTEVILSAGHSFTNGVCTSCGADEYSKGLEFVLTADGNGYVLNGMGTCTDTRLRIPETYEELPVTAIRINLDDYKDEIRSVSIPRFVTYISYNSFSYLTNLESIYFNAENCNEVGSLFYGSGGENGFSVVIGKAVKRIPANLFNERTPKLKSVLFEKGSVCGSIGSGAFAGCGITQIEIPTGVRVIEERAFYGCENLKSVKMTWGVEQIETEAFAHCDNIENFSMSSDIKLLGTRFIDSKKIKYNVSRNLCYLGNERYPNLVLMDVTDHELESYDISPYTKYIYQFAFEYCYRLKELHIPSSVRHIDIGFNGAFYGCINLNKITVDIDNPVYYEKDGCIIEKETKTLILGCKTGAIPDDGSVTAIGDYAFYPMSPESIVNLVIPEGITSIGNGAFNGCDSIESLVLPDTLTHVGKNAFRDCKKLKNITLPSGITKIGAQTFSDCESLESVVIPTSITEIAGDAFSGCKNLAYVFYKGTYEEWEEKAFSNGIWQENTTVYCYASHDWQYNGDEIVIL